MYGYGSISQGAESSLMDNNFYEVYYDVERAIDLAFDGHFVLKFYDYLKIKNAKKKEVDEFIESKTAENINNVVLDLEEYLKGGSDEEHKQLREAYGFVSKPEARKIKNYLFNILQDASRYSKEKRPGRKPKQVSNK
jgi:hypothetical protein